MKVPYILRCIMGYSVIVLSGVCDVESKKSLQNFGSCDVRAVIVLIPVSAGFWREL